MESHLKKLRAKLESALSKIDLGQTPVKQHDQAIRLVICAVEEMKSYLKTNVFQDEVEEVGYFKEWSPYFYSEYFFYVKLYFLELHRLSDTKEAWRVFLEQEKYEIDRFFMVNGDFIRYYYSGGTMQDDRYYRMRASGPRISEDIVVALNEDSCVGSYLATRLLAYEKYRPWLENESRKLLYPEALEAGPIEKYEWKESKSAAVEMIKSLSECQSVYINNSPATTARLTKDFEAKYGVDLSDFDKLLYATDTRKTDETPFLHKLIDGFLGRKKRLRK